MTTTAKPRISAQHLQADIDAYTALKVITGYEPYSPSYSLPAAHALHDKLRTAQEAELHAQHTLSAARDALVATQHEFHELILGVKNQVKALYGPDSDEVAALGLKKKSETKARKKMNPVKTGE